MSTNSTGMARAPAREQTTQQRRSGDLVNIRVDFGPREVFARFLLSADAVLNQMGVTVTFGTFEELVETNRRNRQSWPPLVPTFDPANGLCTDESVVFTCRNAHDEIIAIQAAHLFDWRKTNFKTEAESMRLFYADPSKRLRPEETCTVDATTAGSLCGRVFFQGAAWLHPSVRGNTINTIMARVGRVYGYTRWNADLTMAVMSLKLIGKGVPQRNGYLHIEPGFELRNFELGDYNGGVIWIRQDEVVEELASFMPRLEQDLIASDGLRAADQAGSTLQTQRTEKAPISNIRSTTAG